MAISSSMGSIKISLEHPLKSSAHCIDFLHAEPVGEKFLYRLWRVFWASFISLPPCTSFEVLGTLQWLSSCVTRQRKSSCTSSGVNSGLFPLVFLPSASFLYTLRYIRHIAMALHAEQRHTTLITPHAEPDSFRRFRRKVIPSTSGQSDGLHQVSLGCIH